jgi:predicted nucleic-acid-binding protein
VCWLKIHNNPSKPQTARNLVKNAEQVYITQIVQIEFTWVLAKVYKVGKTNLVIALEHLLENPSFILQNTDIFSQTLVLFKQGQADFSDYLILTESWQIKAALYSFDKRLGKHSEVILL